MKKFKDLKPQESIGLNDVIFSNAMKLKKDAELLIEINKSYSTATSLLVLSTEEITKSILVLLHSKNYNVYKIKDINQAFYRHNTKHLIAQFLNGLFGLFKIQQIIEKREKKTLIKGKGFKAGLANFLIFFAEASPSIFEGYVNISNIDKFDKYKNNGFYVDYRDKILIPKNVIGEKEYLEVKRVIDTLIVLYKKLINFLTLIPNTDYEKKNKKIKENQIHLIIDESFKDIKLNKFRENLIKGELN